MRQTIAFIPGSFSVPHSGHWNMISYYAEKADYVIVLVSSPIKAVRRVSDDSVKLSPEKSKAILDVFLACSGLKNVKVLVSSQPSPVKDTLKIISGLTKCRIIIGQSDKDEKRYGWITDQFSDRDDLSFAELIYHAEDAVSASDIRKNISDFSNYEAVLPDFLSGHDIGKIKSILYAELNESVQIKAKRVLGRDYKDAILTQPGESPDTFNGQKLSGIVSPTGSHVICKFYTDGKPNTEYILCASGEARRIKGNQGGNDMGLHPWRDKMIFSADANDIADAILDTNTRIPGYKPGMKQPKMLYCHNGWCSVMYTLDGKTWYTNEGLPFKSEKNRATAQKWKYSTTPMIGLNTLDIAYVKMSNGARCIGSVHHGHKVCNIEK